MGASPTEFGGKAYFSDRTGQCYSRAMIVFVHTVTEFFDSAANALAVAVGVAGADVTAAAAKRCETSGTIS